MENILVISANGVGAATNPYLIARISALSVVLWSIPITRLLMYELNIMDIGYLSYMNL